MSTRALIYGYSRGYRTLAVVCVLALMIAAAGYVNNENPTGRVVALSGMAIFLPLTLYTFYRAVLRIVVMEIALDGFVMHDPAVGLHEIRWEEMGELRVYATLEQPVVALNLAHPLEVRRRLPALNRIFVGTWWPMQHYQILVQLDQLNDQVAAITAAARSHGVPVRSELA